MRTSRRKHLTRRKRRRSKLCNTVSLDMPSAFATTLPFSVDDLKTYPSQSPNSGNWVAHLETSNAIQMACLLFRPPLCPLVGKCLTITHDMKWNLTFADRIVPFSNPIFFKLPLCITSCIEFINIRIDALFVKETQIKLWYKLLVL